MKTALLEAPVMSGWLEKYGLRLDGNPYLTGGVQARALLERLDAPKTALKKLTLGGMAGIFHAGREARQYVEDPEYGVPFLGSTDILAADLSNQQLISRRQAEHNPLFKLEEGWTLITRSGTVGRMAYARADMAGMACSEHVLRVVPDPELIPPGYLYAYLSSHFGKPLITEGTYGAIIQHIEPAHIADLPVPRLGDAIEEKIESLITCAANNRSESSRLLKHASIKAFEVLGIPPAKPRREYETPSLSIVPSNAAFRRLDGYYFAQWNLDAHAAFSTNSETLGDVAERCFIPGIFRRAYADAPSYGCPYVTGSDVYRALPISNRYLLRSVAESENLILKKGMIIVQDSGQLGGLIGRPVMVGTYLDGFACSNNMVRIVPQRTEDQGYLFAMLNTEYGISLMTREASGSSIPHLDERRVQDIPIPWPAATVREELGEIAMQALLLRDEANIAELNAVAIVEQVIYQAVK